MFNLIVKDPRRLPPERTAWIERITTSLRILELAASHFCAHFPFLSKFQGLVKQNRFSSRFSCFFLPRRTCRTESRLALSVMPPGTQSRGWKHTMQRQTFKDPDLERPQPPKRGFCPQIILREAFPYFVQCGLFALMRRPAPVEHPLRSLMAGSRAHTAKHIATAQIFLKVAHQYSSRNWLSYLCDSSLLPN
jgi:hypothetical protein